MALSRPVVLLGCTFALGPHGACADPDPGGDPSQDTSTPEGGTTGDGDTGTSTQGGSPDPTDGPDSDSTAPTDTAGDTGPNELDTQLRELLDAQDPPVLPLGPPPPDAPALVALGEALFFDPILSGNKDIACATCHHPALATGDGLPLALGTGASGRGPNRAEGDHRGFIPRHSQPLFNVGDPRMTRMFWDGRIESMDGALVTPAGPRMPPEVRDPLAAQAMFPVLDRAEMRGQPGDMAADGTPNEIAGFADDEEPAIWGALTRRITALPGYAPMLEDAFPDVAPSALSFADLAAALAAYQRQTFASTPAPFDDYLAGDDLAISDGAKLGAILFYSSGGCANCHQGFLFTDNEFHNTGVPQLGPGRGQAAPFDHGRESATGDPAERFAFRTSPLRNVNESAPYMHNGAYPELGNAIVHYVAPLRSAAEYDPELLLAELRPTIQQDPAHLEELTASLSEDLVLEGIAAGLPNVRAFLETLTEHDYARYQDLTPETVPSGLPVP